MNYKILVIYFISFLLLSIFSSGTRKDILKKNNITDNSFFFSKKVYIRRNFESMQMGQLLLSYTTGDRLGLSKHIKDVHNKLYIMHLFTPSGIHLSSIYLMFLPLFGLIKKRNKKAYHLMMIATSLFPLLLSGFYSIKRVAMLRALSSFTKLANLNASLWWSFIGAFFIDLLLGALSKSPLSFIYSFLFLGAIISVSNAPQSHFIIALLGGQFLIGFIGSGSVNIVGVLLGIFATSIFTILFPIIFFYYLFCSYLPVFMGQWPLSLYFNLIEWLSSLCNYMPSIQASIFILLTFIIFFAIPYKLAKYPLIAISLLIHFIT